MTRVIKNPVFIVALILTVLGLIELSSINKIYFERQLTVFILALFAYFFVNLVPSRWVKFSAYPFYIFMLLLLLILLFLPSRGPKRWLHIGGFTLQVSEVAKLSLLIVLGKIYGVTKRLRNREVLKGLLFTIPIMFLVMIEPDLGTAIAIYSIFIITSYTAGAPPELFSFLVITPLIAIAAFSSTLFVIIVLIALAILYINGKKVGFLLLFLIYSIFVGFFAPVIWEKGLKDYQKERIVAFLAPEKYRTSSAWQIIQAKIALGSGGFGGKGYGEGTQKGLEFLPMAHTDFIFSSFGEEFGFVGTFAVVALFTILILLLFEGATKMRDPWMRVVASGIGSVFLVHFLINVMGNLGLIPVTGIALPFMSQGGTHLLLEYVYIGLFNRFTAEDRALKEGKII